MTDRVEVQGLPTLRATLKVAAQRVEDLREPATRTSAFLAARGRADAPRRTGRLSASVRGEADSTTASTYSALAYANRTHWGYRRYAQRPQPWLAEGAANTEPQWLDNYRSRIENVIRAVRGA